MNSSPRISEQKEVIMKIDIKLKNSNVKDILEIYDDTLIKVTDEKNNVVYKGIVDYAPKEIRDGRWRKGANNKTFTINTEKGTLTVKVLDSSVRDSLQLKTYKIKNHDSGKTYTVKAVNYTDAVKRYNKHILNDSTLSNTIKQLKSKYKVVAEAESMSGFQTIRIYEWDKSKTDSIIKFVNNLLGNLKYYTQPKLGHHYRFLEWVWAKEKKDTTKDSVIEDATELEIKKQKVKDILAKLNIKANLGIAIDRNNEVMVFAYTEKQARAWVDKLNNAGYSARYSFEPGNVKVAKFILKDALTEDALSAFVQSYLSTKKVSSKAEQDEIIKFLLERNKIVTEDIPKVRSLLKIVKDSITEDADKSMGTYNGYSIKQNVYGDIYVLKKSAEKEFFESWKKAYEAIKSGAIKDSITEDAYVYPTNASTAMASSFAKLCVEKFGGKVAAKNGNKYVYVAPDKDTAEKAKTFLETKYSSMLPNVKFIVGDSFAEDADIAQTDIKSTYLPEDANADNIQYLGFNEKRKLSFYGYGDRYFVHYDLEGRTEEIDKETVQKILKKNILGEIDENDLINKEPQSEEIVSDSFENDAGEISIEQFNPKRLVESSKSRKQALHNEIKMKNGDIYTVFFQASGEIENPRSIWVSIVLEKSNGQQERVLTEKANSYEQAIQIMTDWKKKQERGDK